MQENERDTKREEKYYIIYEKKNKRTIKQLVSKEEWYNENIGEQIRIKTCLMGYIYSKEVIK